MTDSTLCPGFVGNSAAFKVIPEPSDPAAPKKALGVLTKSDLCIGLKKTQLEKLKSRLDGTSPDAPKLEYGYVAVCNRDTADEDAANLSLKSAAEIEDGFFEQYLPEYLQQVRHLYKYLLAMSIKF